MLIGVLSLSQVVAIKSTLLKIQSQQIVHLVIKPYLIIGCPRWLNTVLVADVPDSVPGRTNLGKELF